MLNIKFGILLYYVIVLLEVLLNFFCFDGICYGYYFKEVYLLEELYKMLRFEGFGKEVKCCIFLGIFVLSLGYYDVYYKKF